MNYIKYLILIAFLLFSANASAEFYKYVDENGNVRFTDDINEVPEAQRSNIRSYVESKSKEVPEQQVTQDIMENQAEPEEASPAGQQANFPDLSENEPESLEDTKSRLELMKIEIDQEYEALKDAQAQLAEEKEAAKTREQIIEYNQKAEELNTRIKAYVEKGKAYEAGVDAYNQRIMKKNKEKEQPSQ
jgi:hypothetical protein